MYKVILRMYSTNDISASTVLSVFALLAEFAKSNTW